MQLSRIHIAKQINKKLFRCFIIIITKWFIYELTVFISNKYKVEISEKIYRIRLLELITKGIPSNHIAFNVTTLEFRCIYIRVDLIDFNAFITAIFFSDFYSASENKNHNLF